MDIVRELRLAGVNWAITPSFECCLQGEQYLVLDFVDLEILLPNKETIRRSYANYRELSTSDMLMDALMLHSISPSFDSKRDKILGEVPVAINAQALTRLGEYIPAALTESMDEKLMDLGILFQIHLKHLAPLWRRLADSISQVTMPLGNVALLKRVEFNSKRALEQALEDLLRDDLTLPRDAIIDLSTARTLVTQLSLSQWREALHQVISVKH